MSPVTASPHIHPLHAILLAFPVCLFATALAADLAYLSTAEMQWSNFAAWAITGALIFGGIVLAWAVIRLIFFWRTASFSARLTYVVLLAVMWIAGLVNAFQHSRDAWSSVGTLGLALSIVATLCAFVAAWIVHSPRHSGVSVR